MKTKELLDKYEVAANSNVEEALWCLLKINEKNIKHLIEDGSDLNRFHKSFRQIDVCDNPLMDVAIWNLLNESTVFWGVFESLSNEE